jgi:serine/threonine-protein kinase
MGRVFRGRDLELERDVAVKLLPAGAERDPAALLRFRREACAVSELRSRHIVSVYECGLEAEVPYIVMELLEGESLAARLGRGPPITLTELSEWVHQACLALDVAHSRGLIHRDIKPSNLFLVPRGYRLELKLLDFGIVKSLTEPDSLESTLVGSPGYLSPEQACGRRVDTTSDLWSLAAVVYRAVTGVEPFSAPSLVETLERVCFRPIRRPSAVRAGLPPVLDAFIERGLCRERRGRFRSALELSAALSRVAMEHGHQLLPASPRSPPPAAPRTDSTRSWATARGAAITREGWPASSLRAGALERSGRALPVRPSLAAGKRLRR